MREMLDASLGGNMHVEMTFGEDVWPVDIDAGEMELAVVNLCVNARDAMPGGGVITITVENVIEQDARGEPQEFVRLSVADSGVGMLTTGYVEAASGMKDREFDLLPKPYSLDALADALGVDVE